MEKVRTGSFTQKAPGLQAPQTSSLLSLMFFFVLFLKGANLEHVWSWSPGSSMLSLVNPTRGEARQGHVPLIPLVEPSQQSAWNVWGGRLWQPIWLQNATTPPGHESPSPPWAHSALMQPFSDPWSHCWHVCLAHFPLSPGRQHYTFLCVPLCLALCLMLWKPSLIVCQMNEHR